MNYGTLARMALADIAALARSGQLGRRELWTAWKGAAAYTEALASGDVATDEEAERRRLICSACPARSDGIVVDLPGGPSFASYCGPRLGAERLDGPIDERHCGCMVQLTVAGQPQAAGKTLVRSMGCPREKWGPQCPP